MEEILRIEGLTKIFPGVKALDNVSLDLKKEEVHGIVGPNGSGKTTFLKIINGIYPDYDGRIFIDGREVKIKNPRMAEKVGITLVNQIPLLFPNLTVAENIFLGREPTRKVLFFKVIDNEKMKNETLKILEKFGSKIQVDTKVKDLTVSAQQLVEIARAFARDAKIICLDEPTSALSPSEVEHLFDQIRKLKEEGKSFFYVTHRIEEIFQICDRVTVLRDGKKIATVNVSEVTYDDIVKMMVGEERLKITFERKEVAQRFGEPILKVVNLSTSPQEASRRSLTNITLEVYPGEIVGITGIVGAGKTELARALAGLDPTVKGEIYVKGKKIKRISPLKMISEGVIYFPEDIMREGLFPQMRMYENITISILDRLKKLFFIDEKKEKEVAKKWAETLGIKPPNINVIVQNLSGGNKKKVILARGLATSPVLFILDEPTMGIDVKAKFEVRKIIADLAKQGIAVILFSSEFEDVLLLADRILVMYSGRIVGSFEKGKATKEEIMKYAIGMVN